MSIPFFGHFIVISVHRKVAFYGLFVLFRAAFPPLSGAGVDRDHVKKEERYEQAKRYQTAVEGNANSKQTVVLQRQPVRSFREIAPCKGERHQTAKRLWYSELYLSARRKGSPSKQNTIPLPPQMKKPQEENLSHTSSVT